MGDKQFPPFTWKHRLLIAGGMLAVVAGFSELAIIGERLPNAPTDPDGAAAVYLMVYLLSMPIGLGVLAAMFIISGGAWIVTERNTGAGKLATMAFGGVLATAVTVLLYVLFAFPARPLPPGAMP